MLKRGDVVWVKLSSDGSSKQAGIRPAILVSNDKSIEYSPVVHIVPLTTQGKKMLPTHVQISANEYPVKVDSIALCEQINLISKSQIVSERAEFKLNKETMNKIDLAITIQFGLMMCFNNYTKNKKERILQCA